MSKVVIAGDASGTGTFTISAPNGNTDRTLVLPDEAGTVLTSGTPTVLPKGVPVFRAYLNNGGSNLSIGNGVWTKIPFDTENFDSNGFFDNTTNHRFQPTIAGYYQINLGAYISYASTGGTVPFIALYKNGSQYTVSGTIFSSISIYGLSNLSNLVYFNGTSDYVEGYAYYNSPSALVLNSSTYTHFGGFLVRAD